MVLGSLFHPTHMYRALTGRVKDTLEELPARFRLNTPKFNLMTSKEVRHPDKGPNYSVNWTCGNANIEVIDAMKGKVQDTQRPSRLCKFSMFQRWTTLAANKSLLKREEVPPHVPSLYSEAKMGSSKFQKAKQLLFKVKFVQPVFYFSALFYFPFVGVQESRIGRLDQKAHGTR